MSDVTSFAELMDITFYNNDTYSRNPEMTRDVFTLAISQIVHKVGKWRCICGLWVVKRHISLFTLQEEHSPLTDLQITL